MRSVVKKNLQREILLGFWKVRILHHAAGKPVVGQRIIRELRRHGYEISPGTVYPLLARLEQHGWLKCEANPNRGLKDRKEYSLTKKGRDALVILKNQVEELYGNIVLDQAE
jgi:PadR family transcriptional regulator, regulatory protein PadR